MSNAPNPLNSLDINANQMIMLTNKDVKHEKWAVIFWTFVICMQIKKIHFHLGFIRCEILNCIEQKYDIKKGFQFHKSGRLPYTKPPIESTQALIVSKLFMKE